MAEAHVAQIGLVQIDSVGNEITGGDPINARFSFSTEHRILPNVAILNTQGHPTLEDYLTAEASDDFLPVHIDQYVVVTT